MRNPSSAATKTPCCSKIGIKRGPWTPEEDEILCAYINKEGVGRWRTLPKRAGLLRCGKSCRLRWMNYLRPSVKRGHIAPDEEDLILRLHRLLGNRWSLIAGRIPGRTDNEIKNYWNTHLSKKLISQGMDPRTHKPLDPSPPKTSSAQAPFTTPNPPPKPNPSNSQELHGIGANPNPNPNQYAQAQPALVGDDGILNIEDRYIGMCNEDTFSSFLDSLINESGFATTHQQPPEPVVSTAHGFDQGSFWEAELIRNTMDPLLEDMQNGFNDHHQSS